jgi:hypothetical protein
MKVQAEQIYRSSYRFLNVFAEFCKVHEVHDYRNKNRLYYHEYEVVFYYLSNPAEHLFYGIENFLRNFEYVSPENYTTEIKNFLDEETIRNIIE